MIKNYILIVVILFASSHSIAQNIFQDIQNYKFNIKLSDNTDSIYVTSGVKGIAVNNKVVLNLTDAMYIDSITDSEQLLDFRRVSDSIYIPVSSNEFSISIYYRGIPKDGLIIGENKFGNRTFFGDNWPSRAKNWLSVYDHPSDKAKVEFIVKVPKKYTVVSNGKFVDKSTSGDNNIFHYKTSYEIPTKVMVIGVAEFVEKFVQKSPFDIKSFVFPQDKYIALKDYSIAPQVVTFFESMLGRYPFDKLYNVQSTTEYGGMENAGCIFYDENSVDGKYTNESLIAHEIAHQWFGNTLTEKDWNHLWLSEGFATYLENVYMEKKYGEDTLASLMANGKLRVLKYKYEYPNRVLVPEKVDNPIIMLNAYSYQKGAWVLHMIRKEVGDDVFFKSIKDFYSKYKYSNTDTNDFISILIDNYGVGVKLLLEPWLYTSDIPKYKVSWKFEDGKVSGNIIQTQKGSLFKNSIYLLLDYSTLPVLNKVKINSKNQPFEFESSTSPLSIVVDPNNFILKAE